MEFKTKNVCMCKEYKQIKTKANVEMDVIVPDTKPDIYRVLAVKAVADLSERNIRKDKITFSGNVKFTILYVGEGDSSKIYSIENTAPFSHFSDLAGIDDTFLSFGTCSVSKTVFDVKNSRKLFVGAGLDLNAEVILQNDTEIIDVENDFYHSEVRQSSFCCDYLKAIEEFEITLADTVMVPTSDEECEIYDVSIRPNSIEIKTVNNKAIVKGNANICIIYFSDGSICNYDTESSFTEIVDIEGISSEHTIFSHFETSEINWFKSPPESSTQIDIDFKLRGNICAFENIEQNTVSDIYNPDYNYNVKEKKGSFMRVFKCDRVNFAVKDSVSLQSSEGGISKIYSMDTFVNVLSTKKEGPNFIIDGKAENIIIYSDENANLCRIRHITPFQTEITCPADLPNSNISIDVNCTDSNFALTSSREIQIRNLIFADAKIISLKSEEFITDFSVDESEPKQKCNQPSITVYYPGENDYLWDVAKKYDTTMKDIIEVNSLDISSEKLSKKAILIPKRSVN